MYVLRRCVTVVDPRRHALTGCVCLALLIAASTVQGQATTPQDEDLFSGFESTEPSQDQANGRSGELPTEAEQRELMENAYREAKALADAGKCAEAVERFSSLATRSPELRIPALYERGKCLAEMGELDLAIQSFAEASRDLEGYAGVAHEGLGIHIEPYQLLLERAKIEIDRRLNPVAIQDLSDAILLKPTDAELFYYRGMALSKQALQLNPREALQTYEAAVDSLDRAIALKEDYAEALLERGNAKAELARLTGEWEDAIEDLEKARQLKPDDLEHIVQPGFAYLSRARQLAAQDAGSSEVIGDLEKAIESFSRFIEKHPERPGSEPAAGGVESDSSKKEEEDEEATKLENVYFARADARIALAKEMPRPQRRPLYEQAIQDCNLALEVDDRFAFAMHTRGIAWRLLEEYDRAIDDFTEAIELNPALSSEARLRRGIVWFYRGDYELALGDFIQATLDNRRDGRAKFWAAVAHAYLGDHENAIEAYSDALRENPEYALAYGNRGLSYLRLGRFQRAVDDFNEMIRRDRTNALAYYRRGLAYEGLNKREQAARSFRRASQLDPSLARPPLSRQTTGG